VKDFWEQSYFFFETPSAWDLDMVRKKWKEDTPGLVRDFRNILAEMSDFTAEKIKATAEAFVGQREKGLGQLMSPLRLCLVGGPFGPDLMMICEMLGREEVTVRIDKALAYISENTK
jgi:glutamyl-tRNA synthetase